MSQLLRNALRTTRPFGARGIATSPARHVGLVKGYPLTFIYSTDKHYNWDPIFDRDYTTMTRDEWGVPVSIPPELSTAIKHTYYVPPQYYPFLKKLGDDDPDMKPYMDKLIMGELGFYDYEEMFYKFAKPLRITRSRFPMPYRTPEECANTRRTEWESAWLCFRHRVYNDYTSQVWYRDAILGQVLGMFVAFLWLDTQIYMREDMKLFYLEAPEHKINWVPARGDL